MKAGHHFDPQCTQYPTVDKKTAILLLQMAVVNNFPIEHMYIKNSYIHEYFNYSKPIYVKKMTYSIGKYRHGQLMGRLRKNIWNWKSAGYYYIQGLIMFLYNQGYHQFDTDPCLVITQNKYGRIFISITVDYFLSTATNSSMIENF